jgi:hypothetical protein
MTKSQQQRSKKLTPEEVEERHRKYMLREEKRLALIRRGIDTSNRDSLLDYSKSGVIKEFEVLTSRDNKVCSYCTALEGKAFSLVEGIANHPLQNGKCTGKIEGFSGPWCRCTVAPIVRKV